MSLSLIALCCHKEGAGLDVPFRCQTGSPSYGCILLGINKALAMPHICHAKNGAPNRCCLVGARQLSNVLNFYPFPVDNKPVQLEDMQSCHVFYGANSIACN